MYRPEILHVYKSSRSRLPLDSWVQIVGKNLPQFSSASFIYNPITIQVKMAGDTNSATGSVKMSVDATDPSWYPKLVNVLESMTKKKGLTVVNYLGNSIESLSPNSLSNVGECDLVEKASKSPLRLAAPVQPPMYMSHNKLDHLKTWWSAKKDGLAQNIAAQLKGLNRAEIAAATKLDGPIQTTIGNYLERNTLDGLSWSEFSKTYGNGTLSVAEISKKLLDAVRTGLVANEKQIRTYHANIGSEAGLWKDGGAVTTKYKDDHLMYQDIMQDVMNHPLVGKEMVQGLLYGIQSRAGGGRSMSTKKKRPTAMSKHPIQSYYQDYHFNVHGKLPGHVMTKFNKNAGLIASEYPGDRKQAFDKFNLFSGRTIDCGVCSKKKKKEEKKSYDDVDTRIGTQMPKLIPIGSAVQEKQMPKLIPIGSAVQERQMPKLIPIGSAVQEKQMPKLIPIGSAVQERQMPKLIPIGSEMGGERQMPKLIPIGSAVQERQMPKLIPIGSVVQERQMPKLIPIGSEMGGGERQMPKLIPINGYPVERASDAQLNEAIWEDDAPRLMDFLQRKK